MLEYITYKKMKKHKAEKAAKEETSGSKTMPPKDGDEPETPVLDPADESFLERLLNDEGPRPPLPPRMKTPDVDWVSDLDASSTFGPGREEADAAKGKKKAAVLEKDQDDSKPGRLSRLLSRRKKNNELVKPEDLPADEKEREVSDVTRILDRLNLSTKNNKVVPLTSDSSDLLNRFTLIFKDLANGVPTAYDDLVNLIQDREGTLNKGFNKLPKSLQKLVMQLPEKVTGNFAPEIMLAAAHAQGIKAEKGTGLKDQAGKIFMPKNIMELVTKPGAVIGMLKAIVNALRVRWPAFIGMNVIWSVALFLLMFVLWYCYKRGREVRLEQEKNGGEPIDGSDRIEELPDDLMIEGPPSRRGTGRARSRDWESASYSSREGERSRRHEERSRRHEDDRAREYNDDRDARRERRHRRDDDRRRERDAESHSSLEDDRARRHERYRRHDDMTRREEEMMRREEELARREEDLSRRSKRRRD